MVRTFEGGEYPAMGTADRETSTNVVDAALDADALFEVKTEPLSLPSGKIPLIKSGKYKDQPKRNILYRESRGGDGEDVFLNVVHPSHPTSNYKQLCETAEALFPGTCTGFKCLDEGRRIIFTQQIGEEVDLGDGDFIAPNLMWAASLDSSFPSLGMHYLHRLWCMNQERIADVMFKVKRTTRHDQILLERSTILAQSMNVLQHFIKHATFLRQIKVSNSEFERMLASVVPKPEERFNDEGDLIPNTRAINAWEKKRSAIRYYYKEEQDGPAPGTAWAVWNAVQSAESHELTKSADPEKQIIKQVDQLRSLDYPITNAFHDKLIHLDNIRYDALV